MSERKEQGPPNQHARGESSENVVIELAEVRKEQRRKLMKELYDLQDKFMDSIATRRIRELGEDDEELRDNISAIMDLIPAIGGLVLRAAGIGQVEWDAFCDELEMDLVQLDPVDGLS